MYKVTTSLPKILTTRFQNYVYCRVKVVVHTYELSQRCCNILLWCHTELPMLTSYAALHAGALIQLGGEASGQLLPIPTECSPALPSAGVQNPPGFHKLCCCSAGELGTPPLICQKHPFSKLQEGLLNNPILQLHCISPLRWRGGHTTTLLPSLAKSIPLLNCKRGS